MKESFYSELLTACADDARMLDAWMDERASERVVSESPLPLEITSVRQDNVCLERMSGAYDPDVAPGQIRILSKRYTADPDKIPYVAVIEKTEDAMWLIVPFSEYTYPATPGEMTTDMRHFGLRVLQTWNARTVQAALLEKSFLFGTLDERVRQNAANLFRHEFSGKELPESFDALTGPTVIYDADPRRDYLDECAARLRPLSTAVKATARVFAEAERAKRSVETGPGMVIQIDWSSVGKNEVARPFWGEAVYEARLAAGNETEVTDTFVIEKDELSVEYSPEDKKARLTVYDQNDRPNASYDGYGILGKGGEFLGTFRHGALTVPAVSVKGGFQLVDPEGLAVVVTKKAGD